MSLQPERRKIPVLAFVVSAILSAGILLVDSVLFFDHLKVIDFTVANGMVHYAYLGEKVPDLLEPNEVKEKRTKTSYTVYLGKDEAGNDIYRTRAYTGSTFVRDGLAWHMVEYGLTTPEHFAELIRPTTFEKMVQVFGEPAYAVTMYSDFGDSIFHFTATWSGTQGATSGTDLGTNDCGVTCFGVLVGQEGNYIVERVFLPFDTSVIPSSAAVTAASLHITATEPGYDDDNDANAFLTVVETFQSNYASLAPGDFDQCGSAIDNPTEGLDTGNRVDISSISSTASFTLNATGMSWIAKNGEASSCHSSTTGITCLGLREGHDALDSAYNGFDGGFSGANMYSVAQSGTSDDPYLDVTYTITIEQEGFRWRADDGDEDGASWLATQDTDITREVNQTVRLRTLLNTVSNDPPSAQYQLEYREDSATPWQQVISANDFPVLMSTSTTNGTTLLGGVSLTMPDGIQAGDLLIALACNDASSGNNMAIAGWTQLFLDEYATDIVQHAAWAKIAAGSDTATLTGSSQDYAAIVMRINKHGVSSIYPDIATGTPAQTSGANPDPPSLNAGSSKKWFWIESFGADDDDNTAVYQSSGYTPVAQVESAQTSTSCMTAAGYLENETQTENPGTMAMGLSEEAIANTIAIPPFTEQILLSASSNITASGENTTVQLAAPSGKTTSDFDAGRIQDDENPADAVDITSDDYTEMEWSIIAVPGIAQNGDLYQFRVTQVGIPFSTYSVTPEWTIGSSGEATGKIIRLIGGRFHGVRLQ